MSYETRVTSGLRLFIALIAFIASLGMLYYLQSCMPWSWIFLAAIAGYSMVSSALILIKALTGKKSGKKDLVEGH